MILAVLYIPSGTACASSTPPIWPRATAVQAPSRHNPMTSTTAISRAITTPGISRRRRPRRSKESMRTLLRIPGSPIGIAQAPALRTDEEGGRSGYVLFNAGYYPTLDDLAKIALLYQRLGEHGGLQILNRELTAGLLAARGALRKDGDASIGLGSLSGAGAEFYGMGFHYVPYDGARPGRWLLPTMVGAGENEVTLYPNGLVSLIMADALKLPNGENARSDAGPQTIRAVERLQSFGP